MLGLASGAKGVVIRLLDAQFHLHDLDNAFVRSKGRIEQTVQHLWTIDAGGVVQSHLPRGQDMGSAGSRALLHPVASVLAFPVDVVEDLFGKSRIEPPVDGLAVEPLQRGRGGDLVARAQWSRGGSTCLHSLS